MTSTMQQDEVIALCYRDFPPGSVITNVEFTGVKTEFTIREDTTFFFTYRGDICFAKTKKYLLWGLGTRKRICKTS